MNLTPFGTLIFGDADGWTTFLGCHEIQHNLIDDQMLALTGMSMPVYPLGEMENDHDWLLNHDEIHKVLADSLGLLNYAGLADVDLKVENQFYDWTDVHNFEHERLSEALALF